MASIKYKLDFQVFTC